MKCIVKEIWPLGMLKDTTFLMFTSQKHHILETSFTHTQGAEVRMFNRDTNTIQEEKEWYADIYSMVPNFTDQYLLGNIYQSKLELA